MKKKLLLHACCAPCSIHVLQQLMPDWQVTVYFYNPNIHPELEYKKRLKEIFEYLKKIKIDLIEGEYEVKTWFKNIKGLENQPEGGKRCDVCFRMRLEETARKASANGFNAFASVLTISPHKNAEKINNIGRYLAKKYRVSFLENNWKKKEGFKIACQLSRKENFYRQDYCGCVFSKKEREAILKEREEKVLD